MSGIEIGATTATITTTAIATTAADVGRVCGSRDWRMLPIAAAVWAASLAMHLGFDPLLHGIGGAGSGGGGVSATVALTVLLVVVVIVAVVLIALTTSSVRRPALRDADCDSLHRGVHRDATRPHRRGHFRRGNQRRNRRHRRRMRRMAACGVVAMMAAGVLSSAASTFVHELAMWQDPASIVVRDSSQSTVGMTMRITAPPTASELRSSDCRADATALSITVGGVRQSSRSRIRLYASGRGCALMEHGAIIEAGGALQAARFGAAPIWLVADPGMDDAVRRVRSPPTYRRVVARLWDAFFAATDALSDQGRVLVPGLTLGVLGQDRPYAGDDSDADAPATPINETYAQGVEDNFRRSGIMHLMAVSGGHFMLIADMIRRLCARMMLPRRLTAVCVAGAYAALSALMYPSDSVLRALVMGLIGALAMAVGRREQSVSALSWTVIIVVLIDPTMARSFGFALSCAAVLGIVLFARPVEAWLSGLLPGFVAAALSMTLAAQSLTMPIQVLMEPELPLASVPANLLVAPVVGFATVAGLAALMVSWISPHCGVALAWIASCGTRVMEQVAAWIAGGRYALVPWAGGVAGALLVLVVQIMVVGLIVGMTRLIAARRREDPRLPGMTFRPGWRSRFAVWRADTERMVRNAFDQ